MFTVHLCSNAEAVERLAQERATTQLAALSDIASRSGGAVEGALNIRRARVVAAAALVCVSTGHFQSD